MQNEEVEETITYQMYWQVWKTLDTSGRFEKQLIWFRYKYNNGWYRNTQLRITLKIEKQISKELEGLTFSLRAHRGLRYKDSRQVN